MRKADFQMCIRDRTKTLHVTDRKLSYFYGARALNEVFYLEEFLQIENDFPNFTFHLALDRPDPAAEAAGVKYTPGFVHNVIYETCLLYTSCWLFTGLNVMRAKAIDKYHLGSCEFSQTYPCLLYTSDVGIGIVQQFTGYAALR